MVEVLELLLGSNQFKENYFKLRVAVLHKTTWSIVSYEGLDNELQLCRVYCMQPNGYSICASNNTDITDTINVE